MGALLNTPSSGQSEVIETLHYQGAIGSGVPLFRLGPMVSHRYHGDEDREGSDAVWEADVLTAVQALQGLGFVEGRNPVTGDLVDLTSGTPAGGTRVRLTGSGRAFARHPRPRPVRVAD